MTGFLKAEALAQVINTSYQSDKWEGDGCLLVLKFAKVTDLIFCIV